MWFLMVFGMLMLNFSLPPHRGVGKFLVGFQVSL
jgi:hypothetical protein